MNNCVFLGRLVADPELKRVPSGTAVVSFRIAVDGHRYKKAGSDEYTSDTSFLNMEAWDTAAEIIAKWFTKGKKILVEASVNDQQWTTKEGEKRTYHKYRVNKFHFVDSAPPKSAPVADEAVMEGEEMDAEVAAADVPF